MLIPASLFPFAAAFILLFAIALMQVIGLGDLFGDAEIDGDFDLDADVDADVGALDSLTSVLGLGKVPFLIWLSVLLFTFSSTGFIGQTLIESLSGSMLPALIAAPLALLPTVPLTGVAVSGLARILPQDETSAVARKTLLGKRGHIDIGTSRRGSPARAIVKDIHGQSHNVMVEPHEDGAIYAAGDEILLVRQDGDLFFAISDIDRRLGTVG